MCDVFSNFATEKSSAGGSVLSPFLFFELPVVALGSVLLVALGLVLTKFIANLGRLMLFARRSCVVLCRNVACEFFCFEFAFFGMSRVDLYVLKTWRALAGLTRKMRVRNFFRLVDRRGTHACGKKTASQKNRGTAGSQWRRAAISQLLLSSSQK